MTTHCVMVPAALCLVAGTLAGGIARGQEAPQRFEFRQPHMGTEFTLILYTPDATLAKRAADAAFERIDALNRILSDYDPESEAMRLCDAAGGEPLAVSDDLMLVLEKSIALAKRTGGAFDPTVAPVVRLWRRARRTREMPSEELLEHASALVDYRKIEIDREKKTARLKMPGMKLDFGGIAKGYAADEALATLSEFGITRALVAAAGDIVCGDPPPGEPGWKVEVAALNPPQGAHGPAPLLILSNRAVSTSGDAEQFVEIGGVRYTQFVEPRTGVGFMGRSRATVVARHGIDSDSLATSVSVLGPDAGRALIDETPDAAALIVWMDGETVKVSESSRWKMVAKHPD